MRAGGGTGGACDPEGWRDSTSLQTLLEVCWKLPQSVVGAVVTAAVAGLVLVAVKLLNDKLKRHLPLPIPGELLTVGSRERGEGQGRLHPWVPPGLEPHWVAW